MKHLNKKLGMFYVASLSILLLASTVAIPLQGFAEKPEESKTPVIIMFKDKDLSQQQELIKSVGGKPTITLTIINSVAAELPPQAIAALEKHPSVESIYPDLEAHILEDKANEIIGADIVHQSLSNTGNGVTVAVLDTGGTPDHPMFSGKTISCVSVFTSGDDVVCNDLHGHGTHVAGIAVGNGIGNLAAKGVAPDGDLVSVKVLDKNGSGSFSGIIDGMQYVVNNGNPRANIINLSLGTGPVGNGGDCPGYYFPMDLAITEAINAGVSVVASAGNSGNDQNKGVGYPACNVQVIAVAATDDFDNKASFSSIGGALVSHGISAPGVSIYSSVPAEGASCCSHPSLYKDLSGTSMSAPVVSGSIALMLAENNSLSPNGVFTILKDTAVDLGDSGSDQYYGHGRINILDAINSMGGSNPLPTISINDVSISEGDSGTTSLIFDVTRSGDTSDIISVDYATEDGIATAGSDYILKSGSVIFGQGETQKTISITVNGDIEDESDETFFVNLSCTGCEISDGQGVGTIIDDDDPPLPTISINDSSVQEGDDGITDMIFSVTCSGINCNGLLVEFDTADDPSSTGATVNVDYASTSALMIFDGPTSLDVPVQVMGDMEDESDETFFVNLSCTGCEISDGQGVGTIINDDTVSSYFITIETPTAGIIEGKITLTANVSDDFSNPQVTYTMVHQESGESHNFGPVTDAAFKASFHTKDYASGNYHITALADDGTNNVSTEFPLIVEIQSKGGGGGGNDKPCNPKKPGCSS